MNCEKLRNDFNMQPKIYRNTQNIIFFPYLAEHVINYRTGTHKKGFMEYQTERPK